MTCWNADVFCRIKHIIRIISCSYRHNFINLPREAREKSCARTRAFQNLLPSAKDPPRGDPSRLKGPADSAARREESGPYLRRPADVLQLNPSKAARYRDYLCYPPILFPHHLPSFSISMNFSTGSFMQILTYTCANPMRNVPSILIGNKISLSSEV